jgi:hypothetical protein
MEYIAAMLIPDRAILVAQFPGVRCAHPRPPVVTHCNILLRFLIAPDFPQFDPMLILQLRSNPDTQGKVQAKR